VADLPPVLVRRSGSVRVPLASSSTYTGPAGGGGGGWVLGPRRSTSSMSPSRVVLHRQTASASDLSPADLLLISSALSSPPSPPATLPPPPPAPAYHAPSVAELQVGQQVYFDKAPSASSPHISPGPCNSFYCLGHFYNVYDDDDDDDDIPTVVFSSDNPFATLTVTLTLVKFLPHKIACAQWGTGTSRPC